MLSFLSKKLCYIFLILMLPVLSYANEKELVLVKDGKPNATIIISTNQRQAAKLAVAEFQNYVKKITDCSLPIANDTEDIKGIRVLIGESKASQTLGFDNHSFDPEESLVRSGNDYLLIIGKDEDTYGPVSYRENGTYPGFNLSHNLGTLYGVYELLERQWGIRWYFPGNLGEIVPKRQTLIVTSINHRYRPWARHRLVNTVPFPKQLYHYAELQKQNGPLTVNDLADARTVNEWWLHLRVRHEPATFSHYFHGWFDKYYADHPEFFLPDASKADIRSCQPLLHKPEVIHTAAKNAIEHFSLPYDQRYENDEPYCRTFEFFSVSPIDAGRWGTSPEAKAYFDGNEPAYFWNGWASRYVWTFVNAVAKEVRAARPNQKNEWISCLAYHHYRTPYEGMTLEPNVAVMICQSIMAELSPEQQQEMWDTFAAWKRLKPGRFYLWEYLLFPQFLRHNLFPGWATNRIPEYLKKMKDEGVRGVHVDIDTTAANNPNLDTTFGSTYGDSSTVPYWSNPAMDFFNYYIWFKFLYDAEQNSQDMLDEMYENLYGPAGRYIREFIELAEKLYFDPVANARRYALRGHTQIDSQISWEEICPSEMLSRFDRLISKAKAATETQLQKQRVELFDKGCFQMMKASSDAWHRQNASPTAENSQKLLFE